MSFFLSRARKKRVLEALPTRDHHVSIDGRVLSLTEADAQAVCELKDRLAAAGRIIQTLRSANEVINNPETYMTPESFTKPRRHVERVFLHCSASDNPDHDNIATIEQWHLARGFNGVGYHFFIRKDGTIEAGRDLERIPAAQKGNNTGTIAICLHGLEASKFTAEQRNSLVRLCVAIDRAYEDTIAQNVTFHGHCEVSPKSCPVFNYLDWLELDAGYLGVQVEDEDTDAVTVEIPVEVHRALAEWFHQTFSVRSSGLTDTYERDLYDAIATHGGV